MFLSWKRGAQASAPPLQDTFREVYQSRLLARFAENGNVGKGADPCRETGKTPPSFHCQQRKKELTLAPNSRLGKPRQLRRAPAQNRRLEGPGSQKRAESQVAVPGLAEANSQSVSPLGPDKGTAPVKPPQALQELITFLQSQPNGCLKIHPDQIPAVASFLQSAGLPAEEVERLLSSPGFLEKGLSAADLQAAWQRSQGQDPVAQTLPEPQQSLKESKQTLGSNKPSLGESKQTLGESQQSMGEPKQSPATQEIVQTSDYRTLWERLTLPKSMLPTLRLALAQLGASPEDLARLEEESQGHGISLSRVWQVLQNAQNRVITPTESQKSQPSPEENPTPMAMLDKRPVTGEEVAQWQHMLQEAGLKPEVVEQLLGQVSPANQEDLKTTLLALAPPEEPLTVLSDPKPLYLPENLRFRPFFFQGQTNWDQSRLNGNASGDRQYSTPAELVATSGEAFGLPAFAAELQMLNPQGPGLGASLSNTAPAWPFLSPEARESLWSQVQSGIISSVHQGETQVNISLNPPELGQIQLMLHLSGHELAVTAVASRPEVVELANLGVQQLLQALAQQGLVLTQFQVRLQEQPGGLTTNILAGTREKSSEPGEKFPPPTRRRRSSEVDCFV